MATRSWCYWSIGIRGDGSTTAVALNLLTSAFALGSAAGVGAGAALDLIKVLSLSSLPVDMDVILSSDSQTVTPTIGILGAVTLTFPTAIPNGDKVTLYGRLYF